jgi:hypothetical protein
LPQLTLAIGDHSLEQLRCSCGAWAALSLESTEVIRNGVTICGPMPTLQCTSCDTVRLPHRMKMALHELAQEAARRGTSQVRINVPAAAAAEQKFPFCKGVPLTYEALDWLYIPGLSHSGAGFLTPVFFDRDILTYFYNHPNYAVSFGSDTYGTLYTKEGYISFGVNENGKLIMWLGDLDKLSSRDQLLLAAHNVPSDHAIGCEFYDGQIEAVFTGASQERRLIRVSGKFAAALIEKFELLKIFKMDAEAATLLKALCRPALFTESEFGDAMERMTKLFIERLDVGPLKDMLRSLLNQDERKKMEGLRELKTLQLWAERRLGMSSAGEILAPLFVLYDLRVAYKHLLPQSRAEEMKKSCRSRLNLPEDASLDNIYTTITAQLEATFIALTQAVCEISSTPR